MNIEFKPEGVCCRQMNIKIEDNKIVDVEFIGGCEGNLSGIGRLIKGMDIGKVANILRGIPCGAKLTSCPDQLSKCLIEYSKLKSMNVEQKV